MKAKTRSWLAALLMTAVGVLLCPSVQAQIDFSTLDKWRGWRPSDPSPRSQRPSSRERPVQHAGSQESTWRPPDPKEAARMEKMKTEQLHQLQGHWLSVANQAKVIVPVRAVVTSPGSRNFGINPSDPVSFTAPLGLFRGTKVPTESLRRTLAILNATKSTSEHAVSPEDAAFLAGQAMLAMEGAPLQVIVEPASSPQADAAEAMRPVLEETGKQQAELERAEQTRHEAALEYTALEKKEASPQNAARKEELLAVFRRTSIQIDDAKKKLAEYEYILVHKE